MEIAKNIFIEFRLSCNQMKKNEMIDKSKSRPKAQTIIVKTYKNSVSIGNSIIWNQTITV